jgi:hypothetical protein
MTATCHPLPPSIADEMRQVAARALCDRPGDNPAQRDSRTRQMVHSTLGFEPRDGLEYMLSTLVFAHFELILDSMRDVFQGQLDSMKLRTKAGIVALDRTMLAFVKEMRTERRRPLARETRETPATSVPEPVVSTPAKVTHPPLAARAADVSVAAAQAVATHAEPVRSGSDTAQSVVAPSAAVRTGSGEAPERSPDPVLPATPPIAGCGAPAVVTQTPDQNEEATMQQHIADFQAAFAAMTETLAEARAIDAAKADPTATGED